MPVHQDQKKLVTGRSHTVSASPSSNSYEEFEDTDEVDPTPGVEPEESTWRGISFQGDGCERYEAHAEHLPSDWHEPAEAICKKLGFVNVRLFKAGLS